MSHLFGKLTASARASLVNGIMTCLRALPPQKRRRLANALEELAARLQQRRLRSFKPSSTPPRRDAPIVIAGVFRSASGLGAAARSTYKALVSAGLKPIAVDLTSRIAPVDYETDIPFDDFDPSGEGTLIIHLNAPEIRAVLHALDYLGGRPWRVIGYWAWELPVFPKGWAKALEQVNEIWTLSEFTADVFRTHPRAPIVRPFPIPVTGPASAPEHAGIPGGRQGKFIVLVMADARSSFGRKNVFGSIAAFQRAFGSRQNVQLIIKTRNVSSDPYIKRKLNRVVGSAPNITLQDSCLSSADYWKLLSSVDVLLSLHRAEGFGLPLAEAMALGKLVIATNWSGNCSFMSVENSLLVDYRLVPVEDEFALYDGHGGQWAEPDSDQASRFLRSAFEDPASFDKHRQNAVRTIAERLNVADVGTSMREALLPRPSSQDDVPA